MSKKKVLVTGGAGFIGSHLVSRLLEDGHDVTVIDNFSTGRPENLTHQKNNRNLRLIEKDISDFNAMKQYFDGIKIVFHLAALADIVPSIVNPAGYYRSNVTGTFCVAEACRLSGVEKLLYAASSSCYGMPRTYPTAEASEINPQYPYALTKYLGEETLLHWGKVYKLPVISLRLFNVYGPRSRTSGTYGAVFGVFLAQQLNNKPFTIVGDGNQTRDFIYVSDVVEAFIKAAFSDVKNEIFNVGSGNPQSINKLVSLLRGDKIHIPKRPGEPDSTWADISKIQKVLDWQPKVSFCEGIKKMLKNIDYWQDAPVWTPEKIQEATRDWFEYLAKE
ncbi:MAG: SDR family oxidoreductase [Candidatus Omnitrophota bacterium]|nr:MAG: SDR family oxidoreductase [Candidatus Omnitrophota bacterium]